MVFNSLHFVWFFLVVYAAYRVLPHRAQNWLLLVASYYFYAAWDWRFLGLLIASTHRRLQLRAYPGGNLSAAARRAILAVSLGFNLTLLGFFKYFNFFADSLHGVFGALGWQVDFVTLHVLLPVGISFYTFVTMSYVIDVYRREIPATQDLLDFAVFVAFFPHLVAGPILRASHLAGTDRPAANDHARTAARRRLAHRLGILPEDFRRRQPRSLERRSLRSGVATDWNQHPARRLRVCVSNLRRLRGLFEHRPRHVEIDGHRAHREFPLSLPGSHATGVLAKLAHQPVDLASRLPVHSTRRQPRSEWATRRNLSSRWCSAGCGTARRGLSSSGASIRECF